MSNQVDQSILALAQQLRGVDDELGMPPGKYMNLAPVDGEATHVQGDEPTCMAYALMRVVTSQLAQKYGVQIDFAASVEALCQKTQCYVNGMSISEATQGVSSIPLPATDRSQRYIVCVTASTYDTFDELVRAIAQSAAHEYHLVSGNAAHAVVPHALEPKSGNQQHTVLCLDSQTGQISRRLAPLPRGGSRPASKFHYVHIIETNVTGCFVGRQQLPVPHMLDAWVSRFPSGVKSVLCAGATEVVTTSGSLSASAAPSTVQPSSEELIERMRQLAVITKCNQAGCDEPIVVDDDDSVLPCSSGQNNGEDGGGRQGDSGEEIDGLTSLVDGLQIGQVAVLSGLASADMNGKLVDIIDPARAPQQPKAGRVAVEVFLGEPYFFIDSPLTNGRCGWGATSTIEPQPLTPKTKIISVPIKSLQSSESIPLGRRLYAALKVDNLALMRRLLHSTPSDAVDHLHIEGEWKMQRSARQVLHAATILGASSCVQQLIVSNASVDYADSIGCTALHRAAEFDHEDCLALLVSHRASVDAEMHSGATPLHRAGQCGSAKCANQLIIAGANPNHIKMHDQSTPLWVPCARGDENIVRLLLAAAATVDHADARGITPLGAACNSGELGVVKLLVDAGANTHNAFLDKSALDVAMDAGKRHVMEWLRQNTPSTAAPVGI